VNRSVRSRKTRMRAYATLAAIPLLLPVLASASSMFSREVVLAQSSSHPSKSDYALIYGTVWDSENHPVAGVPVRIRRASDKKPKWDLVSDSHGEFAQRVPPGTQDYVVEADIKMPNGQPKPETKVHIDDNERRDISLHLTEQAFPNKQK
jgi:hypothetical protein